MSTVVCLSSLPRYADVAMPSFCRRVLRKLPGPIEVVCHFPTTPDPAAIHLLKAHAARVNVVVEPDPELTPDQLTMTENMTFQRHGVQGNLLQWHSMKRVCEVAASTTGDFRGVDLVLWARPDLYYWDDVCVPRRRDRLLFASHDHWGGVNDRVTLGPPHLMRRRLRIYDYFHESFYPAVLRGTVAATPWNAEAVLLHLLEQERLPFRTFHFRFSKLRHITGAPAPGYYVSAMGPYPRRLLRQVLADPRVAVTLPNHSPPYYFRINRATEARIGVNRVLLRASELESSLTARAESLPTPLLRLASSVERYLHQRRVERRIAVAKAGLDCLVCSPGATATPALMRALGANIRVNDPAGRDALLHSPRPPRQLATGVRVVYVFDDPIEIAADCFRLHQQYQLRAAFGRVSLLTHSLEDQVARPADWLGLERSMRAWTGAKRWSYPILFLRSAAVSTHTELIAEFAGVPPIELAQLRRTPTVSSAAATLSPAERTAFEVTYGRLRDDLERLPDAWTVEPR